MTTNTITHSLLANQQSRQWGGCGHWSDWAGALFSVAFAIFIFTRSPLFSILLLPAIAHDILVAVSFLARHRSKRGFSTWYARGVAYGATYVIPIFMIFAQTWYPHWLARTRNTSLTALGGGLWLFGSVFGLWAVWSVRRSFSFEPQARELVISGPYTIARHPIYLSYVFQCTGILLAHLTIAFSLIYAVWFALMFIRARFEEHILLATFPAYETYRHHVGMFGPVLLRKLV